MAAQKFKLWFKTQDQRTHVWRGITERQLPKALKDMQRLHPNWIFWRLYASGGNYVRHGANPDYIKGTQNEPTH